MNTASALDDHQLSELARFLEEHPTFSPVFSDETLLCGFRAGLCCLSIDNVEELFFVPRERRLSSALSSAEAEPGNR